VGFVEGLKAIAYQQFLSWWQKHHDSSAVANMECTQLREPKRVDRQRDRQATNCNYFFQSTNECIAL